MGKPEIHPQDASDQNRDHSSTTLVSKKEQGILTLLDNLCPECQREGFNGHCTSCGYFPEGNEWDDVSIHSDLLRKERTPKRRKKEFRLDQPITEHNQIIQHYPGGIRCGLFSMIIQDTGNIVLSLSIDDGDKKHYFYVVTDLHMRIKGFSENKYGAVRLLDRHGNPIRGIEYYRRHIKSSWAIEPFIKTIKSTLKK